MSAELRSLMSTAFACSCGLLLHAQTPTSAQTNRSVPGEIVVTGCVERADQMAASTTAAATGGGLNFLLVRARTGTATDDQATGTTGSTGTDADAQSLRYRLDADVATLNPHVGHKIEVTGTLEAPMTAPSERVEPVSPIVTPRLKVDHIKMIAESCARHD